MTEFFDVNTERAVKSFQKIFNLTQDGIVGKSTWYKIKSIFNGVKSLAELETEGLTLDEVDRVYSKSLTLGDSGAPVSVIQYYLSVIGFFDPNLPIITRTGVFDEMCIRDRLQSTRIHAVAPASACLTDGQEGYDIFACLLKCCLLYTSCKIRTGNIVRRAIGGSTGSLDNLTGREANNCLACPSVIA